MEEHTTCKHLDISGCDSSCECVCDDCQIRFEAGWAKRAEEKNLCIDCGVPMELTAESLIREQYTHFFQPCQACADVFKACMEVAKLCEKCHSYMGNEPCKRCSEANHSE